MGEVEVRSGVGGMAGLLVLSAGLLGCGDGVLGRESTGLTGPGGASLNCSIPTDLILSGGPPKDGIPALTDPTLVSPGHRDLGYLDDDDRVIGLEVDGRPVAIPLNIMWWHEIVNLTTSMGDIAVTHCPLTGSTLAFERGPIDGAELGVSGLLYMNNLLMYDRTNQESLWPQMLRGARCGPRDGMQLPMYPVVEMTYAGWLEARPDTRVVSSATGWDRDYFRYPYGPYADERNTQTLFPMPEGIDQRRPPKELTLGIPSGRGGVAFPFGALDDLGSAAAVHRIVDGEEVVVLWERSRRAAMAFRPAAGGEALTFTGAAGRISDEETGSVWRADGVAVEGPLEGTELEPVADAFVAFWFAWAGFYPDVELWEGGA